MSDKTFNIDDIKEIKAFDPKSFKTFYAEKASLLRLGKYIFGYFKLTPNEACILGGELLSILKDSVLIETSFKCPDSNREIIRFILK